MSLEELVPSWYRLFNFPLPSLSGLNADWGLVVQCTSFEDKGTICKRDRSPGNCLPLAFCYVTKILLAILIPACASSSPAFLMMCSAYKLNKQGDSRQPLCTPFPIWNQSVVPCRSNCCFLTCVSYLNVNSVRSGIPIRFLYCCLGD